MTSKDFDNSLGAKACTAIAPAAGPGPKDAVPSARQQEEHAAKATWAPSQYTGTMGGMRGLAEHRYKAHRALAAKYYVDRYSALRGVLPPGAHQIDVKFNSWSSPGRARVVMGSGSSKLSFVATFPDTADAVVTPALALSAQDLRSSFVQKDIFGPASPCAGAEGETHLLFGPSCDQSQEPDCGQNAAVLLQRGASNSWNLYLRTGELAGSPAASWKTTDGWEDLAGHAELAAALDDAKVTCGQRFNWQQIVDNLARVDWVAGVTLANKRGMAWPQSSSQGVPPELLELGVDGVQLILESVDDWAQPGMPAVLAHLALSAMAHPKGTENRWRMLENKLFGKPEALIGSSKKHGRGFDASLMDGPSVSLLKLAGLDKAMDQSDAFWGNMNWQRVLDGCPSVTYFEIGEQDDRPGMSDVFYWVAVDDPYAFTRELRSLFVSNAVSQRS